jgi:gliding motility-associated-like protein
LKFLLVVTFLFSLHFAQAQTCTGSLGDPILNITFGSGATYGPPLPPGTTSALNFVATTCPPDGNYAILHYTSGCFASDVAWHTTTDHTGDSNGFFMLINASYQPSDFYIQTINGLCTGTTYQFAAWLINMCSITGTLPNITMTIEKTDGTILDTYNTSDIPIINPVTWKQYAFNFTTPSNVSTVILRMRNNAHGGVGNDVGLDDITFRPIGPSVGISAATIAGDTVSFCTNDNQNIILNSTVENCYSSTAYQWQISTDSGLTWKDIPGETGPTFIRTPTTEGTYSYRLAVAQQNSIGINTCRVNSKPFTVNVYKNDARTINISKSPGAICEGNALTFTATTTFAGDTPSYQWQLNGNPVSTNAATYTNNSLVTGDVINCLFKSSIPCNTPVFSNSITVLVNRKTDTIINQSICEGESYAGYTTSGTYTDVFTGSNGCDSTRILNLTVYPVKSTIIDTTICSGASFEGYNVSGNYTKTYSTVNGCDSILIIHLLVIPNINQSPYTDTMLCTGDSIVLSPGNFDSYLWQDGSVKSNFTVMKGGTYSVRVTNKCGATIKEITVNERVCNIMFPNAFTPNNDNINDVFRVLNAYHLTYYHCIIYNRWGQKLFESNDPQKGWGGLSTGLPADLGTYAWLCDYTRSGNTDITHLKGTVTLLR